jgi:DNA-binding NtrC family response regulator
MPPETKPCQLPEHAKILVVEDEALIALDLEMLLLDGGAAEVIVALSLGAANMELTRRSDINLILVDLHLRDGSGLDLVPTARSCNIPIILTTGDGNVKSDGLPYISKPYDETELYQLVTDVIKGAAKKA